MKISNLTLDKALSRLKKYLEFLGTDQARQDEYLREVHLTATIKSFELCYELAVKLMFRELSQSQINKVELRRLHFADLMREAAAASIIDDPIKFINYRKLRNNTAHNYDTEAAEVTCAQLPGFVKDVEQLLAELKRRNK